MPFTKSERQFLQKQFEDLHKRISDLEEYIERQSEPPPYDSDLFHKLKKTRLDLTNGNKQIPLYTILTNRTLEELATHKPVTLDQMKDIYGIGPHKVNLYGDAFIKTIIDHVNQKEQQTISFVDIPVALEQRNSVVIKL